jgi:site-specific DNA recombinase
VIAAYLRVSSEEQAQNQNIDLQRVEIQRYCTAHQLQAVFYEDAPASGMDSLEDRPGGARLLKALATGQVKRVLVWRLDRLGREMLVLMTALAQIEKHAQIESTTEGVFSLKDPTKILMTAVTCGMASAEKAAFLFRTRTGSRNVAERKECVWMGGVAPYGFRQAGFKKAARLEPSTDPISPTCKLSEADVIRLIFKMAADGDLCIKIARHLNEVLGIPPSYADPNRNSRRGGGTKRLEGKEKERGVTAGIWWPARIRTLIANTVYKGEHVWSKRKYVHRGEDGKRHWPRASPDQWVVRPCTPIVTPELWAQANATLAANRAVSMSRATKHQYLLSGLIRCQSTAHDHAYTYTGISVKQKNGTERVYYRCASQYGPTRFVRERRCTVPSLDGKALEAAVWSEVKTFLVKPGEVIRKFEKQMEAATGPDTLTAKIKELEDARKRNELGRQFLLRQASKQHISEAQYERELQSLNSEDETLAHGLAEMQRLAADREARALALGNARTWMERLRDKAESDLTFEERRAVVRALVDVIRVEPVEGQRPKITVTYNFEPHATRYAHQWDGDRGIAANVTASRKGT